MDWSLAPVRSKIGVFAVALLLLLAIIGPAIAPYATTTADPAHTLVPRNGTHWFGTLVSGGGSRSSHPRS